jgi:hypothetical protein
VYLQCASRKAGTEGAADVIIRARDLAVLRRVAQLEGADSPPPPLSVVKTGKNHLNEEITSLLPTGIGKRFNQTISNLGHAALLRRCELPL